MTARKLLPEYADHRVHTACGSPAARLGHYDGEHFTPHSVGYESYQADPLAEYIQGDDIDGTDWHGRPTSKAAKPFWWHRHEYVCHHCCSTISVGDTRVSDEDLREECYDSCHE